MQAYACVDLTPCWRGACYAVLTSAGFVIARELRVECDPFGSAPNMPDISSKGPYQKRRMRNLLPVNPPDFVPGEREARPKMPWKKPPRQHPVPKRCVGGGGGCGLWSQKGTASGHEPLRVRVSLSGMFMLMFMFCCCRQAAAAGGPGPSRRAAD